MLVQGVFELLYADISAPRTSTIYELPFLPCLGVEIGYPSIQIIDIKGLKQLNLSNSYTSIKNLINFN